jgi:hypothetical protein
MKEIMMRRKFSGLIVAMMAFACIVGTSAKADAAFVATICNDIGCLGGDDITVLDNGAGDTSGIVGAISFSTSAFGYTFLVNTSQSKPTLGSASEPQLDLTYTATSGAAGGTVFLYASDTDFIGAHSYLLTLGGTNSGGSGTVTGRAWGGTTNTALQFSGANLLCSTGALSGSTIEGECSGLLSPSVNPYSLTIGVAITRTSAGTSTGDLNLQVPEPASMTLFGLGMLGFGIATRRRARRS